MTTRATQLYKAFPIKDFGVVGWAEVQTAYEKFEYIFGFELLENIMQRGGFELKEWIALKSGDEAQVRAAFNWYAHSLLTRKRGKKMSESNAVKVAEAPSPTPPTTAPSVDESLGLKIVEKIEKFGAGTWELLHKESSKSDGWAETTKALEVPNLGVVVKVTCSCRNDSGVSVLTNTTTFIPGAAIVRSTDTNGVVVGRQLAVGDTRRVTQKAIENLATPISKGKRKGKKVRAKGARKALKMAKIPKPIKAKGKKKYSGRGRPPGSKNKPK